MNNMWKTFRRSGRVTWKATVVLRIAAWDEMRVRTYRKILSDAHLALVSRICDVWEPG